MSRPSRGNRRPVGQAPINHSAEPEREARAVVEIEAGQWLWYGGRARQVRHIAYAPPTRRTYPDRVAVIYFEDDLAGITGDEGQTVYLANLSEVPK